MAPEPKRRSTSTDDFRDELRVLLNKHSMENGSDTPDFILAKYMLKCLTNFDEASVERDTWYGRQSNGQPFPKEPPEAVPMVSGDGGGGGGAAGNPYGPSFPAGGNGAAGVVVGGSKSMEPPAWLLKSAIGFLLSWQTTDSAYARVGGADELQRRLAAARKLAIDPEDFIEWASELPHRSYETQGSVAPATAARAAAFQAAIQAIRTRAAMQSHPYRTEDEREAAQSALLAAAEDVQTLARG